MNPRLPFTPLQLWRTPIVFLQPHPGPQELFPINHVILFLENVHVQSLSWHFATKEPENMHAHMHKWTCASKQRSFQKLHSLLIHLGLRHDPDMARCDLDILDV